MSLFLGIDTSNYTTSAALYDRESGEVFQEKMLLPVKAGEKGIRQSDAVFHHTQQLPQMIAKLHEQYGDCSKIAAIGVSTTPRRAEGSYMPCFTVGSGTARILSEMMSLPLCEFSHQEGHIAAALYSAERLDLMNGRFLAFHVSGGTTEAVMVQGDGRRFVTEPVAASLDLKAGQAIDRAAVMLGLPFPGGRYLEELALTCTEEIRYRPTMRGCDCSLSGIENKCRNMWNEGQPREKIAKFCLIAVMNSIIGMTDALLEQYGALPLVYAGGVMSNGIMRRQITARFRDAHFAAPEFSCDNAAGIAVLTAMNLS
jgi:N6-L-threonylcarbamoyladenine synthase